MADKMKLTKTSVASAKGEPGKQVFIWDTDVKGFGLRISGGGQKAYILQRRIGRTTRRRTIAQVGDLTPDAARSRASVMVAEMVQGVDAVADQKVADARSMTLSDAITRYRNAPSKKGGRAGQPKKARTQRDIEKVMGWAFSDWDEVRVTDISGDLVRDRYMKLAERSPAQANLAMRYLRAALNHVNADSDVAILDQNPIDRLNRAALWRRVKPSEKVIHADDLPTWLNAVQTGLVGLKWERELRDMLLFMILTGCRRGEVHGSAADGYPPLAWSDVDLNKGTVTFRDTKNGSDHTQPIGPKLAAMLKARKEVSGPTHVFSNSNDEVTEKLVAAQQRVKKVTGLDVSPHALRSTFITLATARVGLSEIIVKSLVNHSKAGDVTAGYARYDAEDMREAMGRIESALLA